MLASGPKCAQFNTLTCPASEAVVTKAYSATCLKAWARASELGRHPEGGSCLCPFRLGPTGRPATALCSRERLPPGRSIS
jgi:hypothetical protein